MLALRALTLTALLATSVLAVLPPAGGPYVIVNKMTGLFFDVNQAFTTPGTPIIAFPFNGGGNQKWNLSGGSGAGTSANYTFSSVGLIGVNIGANASQGAGLTVQPNPTVFTVTDQGNDGAGETFGITLAGSLGVTSTTALNGPQLTMQTFNPANGLQIWRIIHL